MDLLEIFLQDEDDDNSEDKAEAKTKERPELIDDETFDTLLEEFRSDDKEAAREAFKAFMRIAKHVT